MRRDDIGWFALHLALSTIRAIGRPFGRLAMRILGRTA